MEGNVPWKMKMCLVKSCVILDESRDQANKQLYKSSVSKAYSLSIIEKGI